MIDRLPLAVQTMYADLLEKARDAQIRGIVEPEGTFVPKTVKGRQYWYIQTRNDSGRQVQRYVGPETPELLSRIERAREIKDDARQRRHLVRSLARGGVPAPPAVVGRILKALAEAGTFRLRAVLVGTQAYQTYAPMLGVRLPAASLTTEDIDLAQFRSVSVAVEDSIPGTVLEALKTVDRRFRPVTRALHEPHAIAYRAGGLKVEFLTPMRGPDEDAPGQLPALGTASQPLRFLDFLIYGEIEAVVLYADGILVRVPDPTRFALHKLIIAERRRRNVKSRKDLVQAASLLEVLIEDRPDDVRDMWEEMCMRGPAWRHLAEASIERIGDRHLAGFLTAPKPRTGFTPPAG